HLLTWLQLSGGRILLWRSAQASVAVVTSFLVSVLSQSKAATGTFRGGRAGWEQLRCSAITRLSRARLVPYRSSLSDGCGHHALPCAASLSGSACAIPAPTTATTTARPARLENSRDTGMFTPVRGTGVGCAPQLSVTTRMQCVISRDSTPPPTAAYSAPPRALSTRRPCRFGISALDHTRIRLIVYQYHGCVMVSSTVGFA